MANDRFVFFADWLDPCSGVKWQLQLLWYAASGELELVRLLRDFASVHTEHMHVGKLCEKDHCPHS
jgi:hypothetical protein